MTTILGSLGSTSTYARPAAAPTAGLHERAGRQRDLAEHGAGGGVDAKEVAGVEARHQHGPGQGVECLRDITGDAGAGRDPSVGVVAHDAGCDAGDPHAVTCGHGEVGEGPGRHRARADVRE